VNGGSKLLKFFLKFYVLVLVRREVRTREKNVYMWCTTQSCFDHANCGLGKTSVLEG
jgi:hypothetical protein